MSGEQLSCRVEEVPEEKERMFAVMMAGGGSRNLCHRLFAPIGIGADTLSLWLRSFLRFDIRLKLHKDLMGSPNS